MWDTCVSSKPALGSYMGRDGSAAAFWMPRAAIFLGHYDLISVKSLQSRQTTVQEDLATTMAPD